MAASQATKKAERARSPGSKAALAGTLAALLLLTACADNEANMLNAAGPAAARISALWWFMFALGGLIYVGVMAFLLAALFRRRAPQEADEEAVRPQEGTNVVIWAGAIMPAIVLLITYGATVYTMIAVNEPEIREDLVVEVTGNQWWWDVRYPELGLRTANEIYIPVGEPVAFKLLSEDVIHSFWVPRLHGKLDMIPGQVTEFWLEASEPGLYLGECAEFCGIQHAKMQFWVIAVDEGQFEQWVAAQQQPAAVPDDSLAREGQQIFQGAGCAQCHAVAGTGATGEHGPDLTHLASRRTLAAGAVANNRGNLGGWILEPDSIKPGSLMPATPLTGAELQALLAYLETLQ